MSYGYRGELRTGQLAASIVKASEAAVMLDLTEDGLRLDRAHASVVQPPFARKKFLRMIPILPASDIYVYGPVALTLEAQTAERTPFAVLGTIQLREAPVPKVGLPDLVSNIGHMLSHRAYEVVLLCIIVQVLRQERILECLSLELGMEKRVLHIAFDAVLLKILVVLFAAVSGVRNNLGAVPAISLLEGVHVVDERAQSVGRQDIV